MLNKGNLIHELLITVPELSGAVAAEFSEWDDEKPGNHVVFGIVVNPALIGILDPEARAELEDLCDIYGKAALQPLLAVERDPVLRDNFLRRFFEFCEQMAESPDMQVRDVLAVTICERLQAHKTALQRAGPYLGPRTKAAGCEVFGPL
jgi:hypothetical protein